MNPSDIRISPLPKELHFNKFYGFIAVQPEGIVNCSLDYCLIQMVCINYSN